ncbi:hypothetical protein ACFQDZ_00795 [Sulfitobacter pacificus]
MEFIVAPNVVTGVLSLIFGLLVMRTFAPYAFRVRGHATVHLGAALFWLAARGVGRSVWWDFFQGFDLGNSSNWFWNLMSLYATYHALRGFLLLLGPEEREDYNILTVAFYPRRLWKRIHGDDEK